MNDADDAHIVLRCLDGDRQAFESLVSKYQKPVFNLALRMVKDYKDAEDITQTAFVKAFENLQSFSIRRKFFSWLYRIAINESLNFLSHRKRLEALGEDRVSTDKSPEETVTEADQHDMVEHALMRLSPDYRSVVVLKHLQGLSYKEIGDILEIPEKTVKSRLFTARQQLKDLLTQAAR